MRSHPALNLDQRVLDQEQIVGKKENRWGKKENNHRSHPYADFRKSNTQSTEVPQTQQLGDEQLGAGHQPQPA